jgi:hypothetical protein
MKNRTDKIVTVATLILCVVFVVVCIVGGNYKKETERLEEQINTFVLAEESEHKEVNLQRAFFHATLTNGNTLLESEDGNLWEFDNLKADENSEFIILFDEDCNLLGLWQAA